MADKPTSIESFVEKLRSDYPEITEGRPDSEVFAAGYMGYNGDPGYQHHLRGLLQKGYQPERIGIRGGLVGLAKGFGKDVASTVDLATEAAGVPSHLAESPSLQAKGEAEKSTEKIGQYAPLIYGGAKLATSGIKAGAKYLGKKAATIGETAEGSIPSIRKIAPWVPGLREGARLSMEEERLAMSKARMSLSESREAFKTEEALLRRSERALKEARMGRESAARIKSLEEGMRQAEERTRMARERMGFAEKTFQERSGMQRKGLELREKGQQFSQEERLKSGTRADRNLELREQGQQFSQKQQLASGARAEETLSLKKQSMEEAKKQFEAKQGSEAASWLRRFEAMTDDEQASITMNKVLEVSKQMNRKMSMEELKEAERLARMVGPGGRPSFGPKAIAAKLAKMSGSTGPVPK